MVEHSPKILAREEKATTTSRLLDYLTYAALKNITYLDSS